MKSTEWKLGLSTRSADEKTFKEFARNGIKCMEVSLPYTPVLNINWKEIKQNSSEYDVEAWSFHLPFYPFDKIDISSSNLDLRKKSVEELSEFIKYIGDTGIKHAVIHPSGEPISQQDRKVRMECAKDSLAKLAGVAAENGVVLAVEDLPRTCLGNCSDEMIELISVDSNLRVCFDSNHLLEENNRDFLNKLGEKIDTVHISDYDLLNERHWLPYEGVNNWVEIVALLENSGYCGPWMYEVSLKRPKSIVSREITLKDFVDNYNACINKIVIAPVGIPDREV